MKKTLQLMKFLHKAGGTRLGNNGKGTMEFLPQLLAILAGTALFGFLGMKYGVLQAFLGAPESMCQALFMIGAVLGVMLTLPQLLNYMYFSDDFSVLLSMPFSNSQILMAKMISSADWLVSISFIFTVPFAVTSGIVCGMGPMYYLTAVLACICIPLFVLPLLASVLMIIMFFVKGMRKSDTTKVIGALVGVAGLILYAVVMHSDKNMGAIMTSVAGTAQKMSVILPINIFLGMILNGNAVFGILGLLGACILCMGLLMLLAKTIYLPAVLSMGESSSKAHAFDEKKLAKESRSRSMLGTYLKKEYRMVRRDPAFLMKGFLMTLIYPAIFLYMMVFASSSEVSPLALAKLTTPGSCMMWCLVVTTLITFVSATTNGIVCSSISREGEEIQFLKQSPVPFKIVLKAKYLLGLLVCAAGTTSYVLVGGIILAVMGKLPFWCIPYALVINLGELLLIVSVCVLRDIKKPFLSWDNQAIMLKKTVGGFHAVLLLAGLILPLGLLIASWFIPAIEITSITVLPLLFLLGGIVMLVRMYKVGYKKMLRY